MHGQQNIKKILNPQLWVVSFWNIYLFIYCYFVCHLYHTALNIHNVQATTKHQVIKAVCSRIPMSYIVQTHSVSPKVAVLCWCDGAYRSYSVHISFSLNINRNAMKSTALILMLDVWEFWTVVQWFRVSEVNYACGKLDRTALLIVIVTYTHVNSHVYFKRITK